MRTEDSLGCMAVSLDRFLERPPETKESNACTIAKPAPSSSVDEIQLLTSQATTETPLAFLQRPAPILPPAQPVSVANLLNGDTRERQSFFIEEARHTIATPGWMRE